MFKQFWKDRNGAFAIIMSLTMVPLFAMFALAASYADAENQRTTYQSILDGAALAAATAATNDSDEVRKTRAMQWLDAQVAAQNLTPPVVTFEVKNGEVVIGAKVSIKPFLRVLDFTDLTLGVTSTAAIAKDVIRRVLDVAMCIDATGSMQNTIDSVKARAQSFSTDLNTALAARGFDKFDYTRIRVIFYRDYQFDNGKWQYYSGYGWYLNPIAMSKSNFYNMPDENTLLKTFIGTQNAAGGGDLPESGYECINEGMSSSWFKIGDTIPGTTYKAQEIYPTIILWSDADAKVIPNNASINSGQYPTNMPKTQAAFTAKWSDSATIDQAHRLLVHFGLCNNSSWSLARSLTGYLCGGTLSEGNTNMINKIADAMAIRYRNVLTRLTK